MTSFDFSSGFATVSVTYDTKGNITSKSDVGTIYSYEPSRPHAVSGISGGPLGPQTYLYDNNGNMTGGGGRTISWTSFNQVKRVQNSGNTIFSEFSFGAGHERIKQVSHTGTTVYIGALFERVTPASGPIVENKHYIYSPTGRIAVRTERNDTTVDTRYFHTDGLGSITAVTNEAGQIVKRFAFDAWGKRVDPSTNGVITSGTSGKFTRGYTDHEQLDDLGLVHMNGRIYDPVLGRFLSADPNVDGVSDAQGFNRYSYVGNNPMNATDPSGYFKLWKDFLGPIVQAVAIVVGTIYGGPAGGMLAGSLVGATINGTKGAIQGAAMGVGFYAGGAVGMSFASSFSGSLLNGGSIGDAFKAGTISGSITLATAGLARWLGVDAGWQNYLFQGFTNGAISEASGGDFAHGFANGIASAFATRQIWTGIAALEKYYAQKNAPQADTADSSSPPGSAPQGQAMGAAGNAQVRDAVNEATRLVDRALIDVRSGITSGKASPEYQAYFGDYDAARAQSVLTVLESVKVELQNRKLVFNSVLRGNSQYLLGDGGNDNVIAWVRGSNPHIVNLQPKWWAMGLQDRAGTIIHELTHLVGGTIDYGYGSLAISQWAQKVPMSAIRNANSYKFYALSVP